MGVGNGQHEGASLTFATQADWTAQDYGDLISDVLTAYNAFLALSIASEANKSLPSHVRLTASEVYLDLGSFTDYEDKLRVARADLHSPGLISFTGAGGPMRQLRELVFDLAVTIPTGRMLLKIIQRTLAGIEEQGQPSGDEARLPLKESIEALMRLLQLASQGRLRPVPEEPARPSDGG